VFLETLVLNPFYPFHGKREIDSELNLHLAVHLGSDTEVSKDSLGGEDLRRRYKRS
jgi:hypothetical protein